MSIILALCALGVVVQEDGELEQLARSLVGEDELAHRFRVVLGSPAGRVVVLDRAGKEAQKLRRQAQRNIVSTYIQTYFVQRDGKYELRKGEDSFRKALLEEVSAYQADLEQIRPGIERVAKALEKRRGFTKNFEGCSTMNWARTTSTPLFFVPVSVPADGNLSGLTGGFSSGVPEGNILFRTSGWSRPGDSFGRARRRGELSIPSARFLLGSPRRLLERMACISG